MGAWLVTGDIEEACAGGGGGVAFVKSMDFWLYAIMPYSVKLLHGSAIMGL